MHNKYVWMKIQHTCFGVEEWINKQWRKDLPIFQPLFDDVVLDWRTTIFLRFFPFQIDKVLAPIWNKKLLLWRIHPGNTHEFLGLERKIKYLFGGFYLYLLFMLSSFINSDFHIFFNSSHFNLFRLFLSFCLYVGILMYNVHLSF